MLALPDFLRPPAAKTPLAADNFLSNVFPPVVCYFTIAFLVLQPRTQLIRLALWPITAILAFRAATSIDMQGHRFNIAFVGHGMFCIATRTLEWAVQTKPLTRHYPDTRPVDQRSSSDVPKRNLVLDALDLAFNLRGCGWDWSQGLYVPREMRPTSSRFAFVTSSLVSGLMHAFVSGTLHSAVGSFSPHTIGSIDGGTIFDPSLPPHLRYLRSSIIAALYAFFVHSVYQSMSQLGAVVGILLFGQCPDQWAPFFDSPWGATSLADFWGRRWHQIFRRTFMFIGGRLFSARAARVIGTFLVSGLYHHLILLAVDPSSEVWRMMLPFGMMGVGMLLERVVAGENVGGWKGWIWTMCWMLLWGNLIVDAFARVGMFGDSSFFDGLTFTNQLVAWLVKMFDDYLHAH